MFWAFFHGTSMASMDLAGAAVSLPWLYPAWSAAEVRSAIVNTANDETLKHFATGALVTDVNIVGSGREDLLAAVNASVALDPVSVSFGAVPDGSGQTQPFTVTLNNLLGTPAPYALALSGGRPHLSHSTSP